MFALIAFDDLLFIKKEEAENLNLTYDDKLDSKKIGLNYNGNLVAESFYYYFKDEVQEKIDEKGNTWFETELGQKVDTYRLLTRVDTTNLVIVQKEPHLVNLEDFAPKCRFPFRILKAVKEQSNSVQSILVDLENKLRDIKASSQVLEQGFNSKCNVHIGGGLIVTFNDFKLLENACTDELQKETNENWRIIAVCVQPDQRRPDYILGRYNPQKDCTETYAKRK